MKPVSILSVLLLYLALFFAGCSLFKKTTKTTHKENLSLSKQTQADMLILKNANKETRIYSYWTDSGVYQFEQIKEQVELVKSGQLKATEKQEVNQESKIKEKEPGKIWFYIGLAAVVFSLYTIVKLFKLNYI